MRDDVRHAPDEPRVGRCAVGMKESCYAAHILNYCLTAAGSRLAPEGFTDVTIGAAAASSIARCSWLRVV